jgi:lysophospholipase L1-like esterase
MVHLLKLLLMISFGLCASARIATYGDSVTDTCGCWRGYLQQYLKADGHSNFDFVGDHSNTCGGCSGTCNIGSWDGDTNAKDGALSTDTFNGGSLSGWASSNKADIVLLHFATNDVWNNKSPDSIFAGYDKMLQASRSANPNVTLVVAKIIPLDPDPSRSGPGGSYSRCGDCVQRVNTFNNAIPAWASKSSTSTSTIQVVDANSGFNAASDTLEGVHPNASGGQKIAKAFQSTVGGLLAKF